MKKIAILVAEGFEEIELGAPLDILRRFRFDVVTAGVGGTELTGQNGLTVKTDTAIAQLNPDDFDGVVLPGGGGSWVLRDTPEVVDLIQKMNVQDKMIAAICAAPIVLAKAGIITGKNISAYPADAVFKDIDKNKTFITGDDITIDGNIITAKGPAIALAFSYTIASYLGKKREDIANMKKAMIYTDVESHNE